jgi:hypothetical protein
MPHKKKKDKLTKAEQQTKEGNAFIGAREKRIGKLQQSAAGKRRGLKGLTKQASREVSRELEGVGTRQVTVEEIAHKEESKFKGPKAGSAGEIIGSRKETITGEQGETQEVDRFVTREQAEGERAEAFETAATLGTAGVAGGLKTVGGGVSKVVNDVGAAVKAARAEKALEINEQIKGINNIIQTNAGIKYRQAQQIYLAGKKAAEGGKLLTFVKRHKVAAIVSGSSVFTGTAAYQGLVMWSAVDNLSTGSSFGSTKLRESITFAKEEIDPIEIRSRMEEIQRNQDTAVAAARMVAVLNPVTGAATYWYWKTIMDANQQTIDFEFNEIEKLLSKL